MTRVRCLHSRWTPAYRLSDRGWYGDFETFNSRRMDSTTTQNMCLGCPKRLKSWLGGTLDRRTDPGQSNKFVHIATQAKPTHMLVSLNNSRAFMANVMSPCHWKCGKCQPPMSQNLSAQRCCAEANVASGKKLTVRTNMYEWTCRANEHVGMERVGMVRYTHVYVAGDAMHAHSTRSHSMCATQQAHATKSVY